LAITQTSDAITVNFPQIGGSYSGSVTTSLGCTAIFGPWIIEDCSDPCDGFTVISDWTSTSCPLFSVDLELDDDYGDATWTVTGPGLAITQTSDAITVNFPQIGGSYSGSVTTSLGCTASFGPWIVADCTPDDLCEDYQITNGNTTYPDSLFATICDSIPDFTLPLTTESGVDMTWTGIVNGQLMAEFGVSSVSIDFEVGIHTVIVGDCFGDCRDTLTVVITEIDCCVPQICGTCASDSLTYQQGLQLDVIHHNTVDELMCPGDSVESSNCVNLACYDLGGVAGEWVITHVSSFNGTQVDTVYGDWFDFTVYEPGVYTIEYWHNGVLLAEKEHVFYSHVALEIGY
jgi:hypothetical protein